jgi:hypothetical protein
MVVSSLSATMAVYNSPPLIAWYMAATKEASTPEASKNSRLGFMDASNSTQYPLGGA